MEIAKVFNLEKKRKRKGRYEYTMAKEKNTLDIQALVDMLGALSPDTLNELGVALKENEIKITSRKEKVASVVVGHRVHTKDWGGKNPRKAGDAEPITERQLANLLNTWVRGKKGKEVDIHAQKVNLYKDFMKGITLNAVSTNFELRPVANIKELDTSSYDKYFAK